MKTKYDKETLIDIFRIASNDQFVYVAKDHHEARRLRYMLYYYRKQMRNENHPFYLTANSITITIDGKRLVAKPNSFERLMKAVKDMKKGKYK